MFLDNEQLEQLENHIAEILPDLLRRNPGIATTIEGILAQHFPRRDEFARLLDGFTGFRHETRQRFDQVDQEIQRLQGDAGQLKTDVGQLKTDVGALRGRTLQQQVRERLPVYLSRFALRLRAVGSAEISDMLDEAAEQEHISEKEAEDAKLIDAVVRGRRRSDNANTYFAVEISAVIDQHDLERAMRRAAVIERATTVPTRPIVVGEEILPAVRTQAEAVNAGWVLVTTDG